jgi:hypothetical protein
MNIKRNVLEWGCARRNDVPGNESSYIVPGFALLRV